MHLNGVVRVKNKVGHATYLALQGELYQNQALKEAHRTYGQVKPPGYGDSVPVQECLKEPRWSAYRERRWGRRTNPPAPAGDVRPGTMATVPVGERLVARPPLFLWRMKVHPIPALGPTHLPARQNPAPDLDNEFVA